LYSEQISIDLVEADRAQSIAEKNWRKKRVREEKSGALNLQQENSASNALRQLELLAMQSGYFYRLQLGSARTI